MATIADRLLELRQAEGLTTREFARRVSEQGGLSVSKSTVSNYEPGGRTSKIAADYLAAVVRTFGVRSEWLLIGTGARRPVQSDAKAHAFDVIAEVVFATHAGDDTDGGEDRAAIYREAANKLRELGSRALATGVAEPRKAG